MNQPQFDAFSRRVNRALGRRSLLRAAVVAAALPGSEILTGHDAAGKRKKRKKCRSPRVKCGKKCLPARACCTNAECAAVIGQVCVANTCECPGGQVVAGNECAQPCNPVCGECQRCDDGACIDLADDSPCSNGGVCKTGICKPDRSFGCAATQNVCAGTGVDCPGSTTPEAKCFVDIEGDAVCGVGLCTNVTTDEACIAELGEGAFVQPCPICGVASKTHICVKPVLQ